MMMRPADDPVAVIETIEMVSIKTVPKIRRQPHAPRRRRMGNTRDNRSKAICMFPRRLGSRLQFTYRHALWLKDYVLAVIQLPVASEDPPFADQSVVQA